MYKIIFCMLMLLLFYDGAQAKSRTQTQAREIALGILNQSNSLAGRAPLSPECLNQINLNDFFSSGDLNGYSVQNSLNDELNASIYMFNVSDDAGFIIVSGDDRTIPILAYSNEGKLDPTNIPDNLKYWLSTYKQGILEIQQLPDELFPSMKSGGMRELSGGDINDVNKVTRANVSNVSESEFSDAVLPLLGSIMWNQSAPYNLKCPMVNSTTQAVTGCVATGMAQVMKYFNYPAVGTGTNSYLAKDLNINLSLDFSLQNFDWSNMLGKYSSTSTNIQKEAVAQLMYSCGVSVGMNYGKTSSAASINIPKALVNYFNYDGNAQYLSRDYYKLSEWTNYIKTELNAGRPVLYAGASSTGAHLFVCDGYDDKDYYHFNWGWGGSSNGYFAITVLNPSDQGIGGTAGGYNVSQSISIGIQKPTFSSVPSFVINEDDFYGKTGMGLDRNTVCDMYLSKIFNKGINAFTGKVGIGIYKEDQLIQVLTSMDVNNLRSNYGWSSLKLNITLPGTLANGSYRIYPVYKSSLESGWNKIRQKVGTQNYVDLEMDDFSMNLFKTRSEFPKLEKDTLLHASNYYREQNGWVGVKVKNFGGEYNSIVTLLIKSDSSNNAVQVLSTQPLVVPEGDSTYFELSGNVTVPVGKYHVLVLTDSLNNRSANSTNFVLGSFPVEVRTAPAGVPNLQLIEKIHFDDPVNIYKNNVVLKTRITNTNGLFNNQITARIYDLSGSKIVATLGQQLLCLEKDNVQDLIFRGSLDLEPGNYLVALYYMDSSSKWKEIQPAASGFSYFTLKDQLSGITDLNEEHLKIYPVPARELLNLDISGKLDSWQIMDMTGRILMQTGQQELNGSGNNYLFDISVLKSGYYILKISMNGQNFSSSFVKMD